MTRKNGGLSPFPAEREYGHKGHAGLEKGVRPKKEDSLNTAKEKK